MKATYLILALISAQIFQIAHATQPGSIHPVTTLEIPVAQEKVVYHVNDSTVARIAMRNIDNHLSAAGDVKIVVVTHGKGIDFLLNDAKDDKGAYAPQVAGLKDKGVEFRVCRNTLKGRNLTDEAVIMEAQVVPSGVAEIGKLQSREGFVYLKP
jgi:intracellular sulfur oxidation DsrE/DsrF family protein